MKTNFLWPQTMLKRTLTLSLIAAALSSPTAYGTDAEKQRGYDIAARSDRSDRGFGDSLVSLKMVLRNAGGRETTRELRISTLEIPDESVGDKSIIIFDSPRDVDGTALLSHARILKADQQWLYLPALKRIKRISSVNKSGPFVGSEFAFEDFTSQELGKYDYRYLRSEPCGELQCDVVERYPRYEHSGYTRQVSWVDQSLFQVRKVDFYNRRDDLLKTLTFSDYRSYPIGNDGQTVWRAHRMEMVNHITGKSTDLIYGDYRFNNNLRDRDFVKSVLKRIR